jgi:hypothetical protein
MLTMMGYYQAIKSTVHDAYETGIRPVGALALVCAAVSITFTFIAAPVFRAKGSFQVGRGLRMHQTGTFITDRRTASFTRQDWGRETDIYIKLIEDMDDSRWESFFSVLKTDESIGEELEEFADSAPKHRPGRGPSDYHIQGSDPVEAWEEMENWDEREY